MAVTSREAKKWGRQSKAYVQQSYDFFVASQGASLGTKPLMLYYSYLNLVKGFLIYRRQKAAPVAKEDRHGLLPSYSKRYSGLASLKFKVSSPSTRYHHIFTELVQECGFTQPAAGSTHSLPDMLYQVPGLHDAYLATMRRARMFFPIDRLEFRQDARTQEVWLHGWADVSCYGEADRSRLSRFIMDRPGIKRVSGGPEQIAFESTAPLEYRDDLASVLREEVVVPLRRCLWSEQTPAGFRYYMGCNPGFTAQVAANFAIMFVLGMVVRYTPELIEELEQDWLIHEYLTTQPLQFAYLLGSGMVRNEIVPSRLAAVTAM